MSILAPSFFVFSGVYVVSFFLALIYSDWFLVWGGLEMNMMSFLGMAYFRGSKECPESLYKYFFVQSVASGVFLVMVMVGGVVSLALMVKLAMGPFFFWLPVVMEGMGWLFNFMLMTVQKFLPLILIEGAGGKEVVLGGLVSLVVGVVGSVNQVNLRKLMAYSSVNHIGWIVLSQACSGGIWLFYFFVYVVVLLMLVFFIGFSDMSGVGEGSSWDLFFMFLMMMNMGGMPPMLGFVMKWMVFQVVLEVSLLVGLMMVMSSLGMLYVYLRVFYGGILGGGEWTAWMMSVTRVNLWVMVLMVVSLFLPFLLWVVGF